MQEAVVFQGEGAHLTGGAGGDFDLLPGLVRPTHGEAELPYGRGEGAGEERSERNAQENEGRGKDGDRAKEAASEKPRIVCGAYAVQCPGGAGDRDPVQTLSALLCGTARPREGKQGAFSLLILKDLRVRMINEASIVGEDEGISVLPQIQTGEIVLDEAVGDIDQDESEMLSSLPPDLLADADDPVLPIHGEYPVSGGGEGRHLRGGKRVLIPLLLHHIAGKRHGH